MYATLDRPPSPPTPAPPPPSTLDLALGFGPRRTAGHEVLFILLALGLHVAVTIAAPRTAARVEEPVVVTEVELPPPPLHEEVVPPKDEAKDEPAPTARPTSAPPPQAARAGALLTAKEAAPSKSDDLVEFVTDPNGTSYGSGVVARGGTADRGERGATANGVGSAPARVVAAAPPGDGLVAAANLSRRATLGESNPCAGYYPSEADADTGTVSVTLVVNADGTVASSAVIEESPAGQGFGKAARACLQRKRFEPSLDRAGKAVAAATTLRVRFVR